MKERFHLLDGIRGLAVVSMVLFHFCYDLFIIGGIDPYWYWRPYARIWQILTCCGFILLSGLCFHLGGKRVKNGLMLNGFGLLVTAVTVIVMPREAIWFGVLNCLGCCLLITHLLSPLLERIPWQAGGAVSFLLFLLTYRVDNGVLGLGSWVIARLPERWYTVSWLAPLGFPTADFVSSDYFPLLPWLLLYLTGYFLGRILLGKRPAVLRNKIPLLDGIGRHSLAVYLCHQPVCMAAAMGVLLLLNR